MQASRPDLPEVQDPGGDPLGRPEGTCAAVHCEQELQHAFSFRVGGIGSHIIDLRPGLCCSSEAGDTVPDPLDEARGAKRSDNPKRRNRETGREPHAGALQR